HERQLSGSYDPKGIEATVRKNWQSIGLRALLKRKLTSSKKEGYVEGPPTLNGEPHMGHLRGRVMKDLWYRYETLRGRNIDFRGGWDCQGLPVELQAEKELGLTGDKTENLKNIGEDKLVETCKSMLSKYHKIWHETDELLGLMIDDEMSYWTYKDHYIEREWQILKSAWKNGILSEGFRVTPFCPHCQTSLSSAEVALGGYETLEDPSMYFKMRVRDQASLFLVVWTTMPFTVVTDELVGVKPDSEYSYVKPSGQGEETWIVGSERIETLMKELRVESYETIRKVKGSELEGLKYEHPLANLIPKQQELETRNSSVHTVVAEEFVDTTTGSGLVHMSPANGEDDFEVSQRRSIPVFNPIDGRAVFTADAGAFSGLFVRDSDLKVSDALKQAGKLLRYGKLKHEYPVCWRSGHRLLYLARRGYFYFVDRLKDKAVDAASNVEYYYEQPRNRFIEIIKEKRPWCVSRERVWGSPLPIWMCPSCGEKLGLFSRKEIVGAAKSLPDGHNFELHRPWIDRVLIQCPKCNSAMKREPFVLDTWHNSGAAPYASLTDEEHKQYLPLPFLTEGIDQTRGWAYTLLIENVIMKSRSESPFASFLFQGHVLDEKGAKLSKSKGNFIPVPRLLSEFSVDLVRLYLMWKASPIDSISFSQSEMITRPYQILNTLYHMHVFYIQNSSFDGFNFSTSDKKLAEKNRHFMKKQDKWLLSKLELLLDTCTIAYSRARYHEAARAIEHFLIDDLSQTYIPIVRSEMWEESDESKTRRGVIYTVLATVLYNCDLFLHPICPYLTDYLASKTFGLDSLLLDDWSESRPVFREEKLEVEFDILSKVVSLTNSARMKAKVKRRWPLRVAHYLVPENERDMIESNLDLILEQTNLSKAEISSDPSDHPISVTVKPNYQLVAPRAKARMNELAAALSGADPKSLFKEIADTGKARLAQMHDFELNASDLIFNFSSSDPKYVVVENFGIVVALDISRDEELIAQGLVRDISRNLQALRKEKGYNPTEVLSAARIAGVGEQTRKLLEPKKEEIAFLVRTKTVEIFSETTAESEGWSTADVDGNVIRIEVA
ncbi:MAG: isoleucine--tRNA ligase, partial [Nitrososphaerota archaeon]|nr:isoleucine--tRNA ligase [Nitrososphaerota archaeon]